MIIIKENNEPTIISIVRNGESYSDNYSLLFQNTLTKDIYTYVYNEDIGNALYHKFEVDLTQLDTGEYYMMLFQNPDELEFYSNHNKPSDITTSYIIYMTNDGNYLVNNGDFLVIRGGVEENTMVPVCTELMRIGEYKNPSTQYKKEQKYIQYGK